MNVKNTLLIMLNRRLAHLPNDERQRLISKVMKDYETIELFTPPEDCSDECDCCESDDWYQREERIRAKQMQFGIESGDNEDIYERRERLAKEMYGKSQLHEAVEAGNVESARKLIGEGYDPYQKDHSGHTCVEIAAYKEDSAMMKLFDELGILAKTNA